MSAAESRQGHDPVHRPSHYTSGKVECIEAIEAALGPEGFIAFLRGQVIKYNWRMGKKDAAGQEAGKAKWYMDLLERKVKELQEVKENELKFGIANTIISDPSKLVGTIGGGSITGTATSNAPQIQGAALTDSQTKKEISNGNSSLPHTTVEVVGSRDDLYRRFGNNVCVRKVGITGIREYFVPAGAPYVNP